MKIDEYKDAVCFMADTGWNMKITFHKFVKLNDKEFFCEQCGKVMNNERM